MVKSALIYCPINRQRALCLSGRSRFLCPLVLPIALFGLFRGFFTFVLGASNWELCSMKWHLYTLQWGSVEEHNERELCHFSMLMGQEPTPFGGYVIISPLYWTWENEVLKNPVIRITPVETRNSHLFDFSWLRTVQINFHFEIDESIIFSVVCVIWLATKRSEGTWNVHVRAIIMQSNLFSLKAWSQVNLTS